MRQSPIIDLINEIRKRPAMYIGHQTLERLDMYLAGYQLALAKSGLVDGTLLDFQNWVMSRYDVKISQGWDNIICFYAGEVEAMDTFWKLFDEFVNQSEAQSG